MRWKNEIEINVPEACRNGAESYFALETWLMSSAVACLCLDVIDSAWF